MDPILGVCGRIHPSAVLERTPPTHESEEHPGTYLVLELEMTLNRLILLSAPLAIAAASGCGLGGLEPDLGPDQDPVQEGLRLSCDASVDVDVEAEATILVEAFRISLSEMIGCGRLTADLAGGVQSGVASAIIENKGDATPEGWTYEGEGLYTTAGGQAGMETRFFFGEDFEVGATGDPVEHNVFLVGSYLVGARVTVPDPLSFQAELRFESPGPLAELLGYGPSPASPIVVDLQALGSIGDRIAGLEFESEISVEEAGGDETIRYELHTDRMRANALLLGSPLRYELGALLARAGDTEVEITQWSAEFFTSGQVEGSTTFDVQVDVEGSCEGTIVFPELPRPSGD